MSKEGQQPPIDNWRLRTPFETIVVEDRATKDRIKKDLERDFKQSCKSISKEYFDKQVDRSSRGLLFKACERTGTVFTAILGNPPKSVAECSDEELAALARAAGVHP